MSTVRGLAVTGLRALTAAPLSTVAPLPVNVRTVSPLAAAASRARQKRIYGPPLPSIPEETVYVPPSVLPMPEEGPQRTKYEKLQDSLVKYLSGLSIPTVNTKEFENTVLRTFQTDRDTVRSALDIIAHDPDQSEDIKSKARVVMDIIQQQIVTNWSRTALLQGGRRSRRKARRARRARKTQRNRRA